MNKVGNRLRIGFSNPFGFPARFGRPCWTGYMQFGLHEGRYRAFAKKFRTPLISIDWGIYIDDVAASQMRWRGIEPTEPWPQA